MNKEINPHFNDFLFNWEYKFYFLLGGYGSSKSYHVALKVILKLLEEKRTALVVREVYETIKDSCFSLFQEIVEDMDLESFITFKLSPLQITFKNGSKIIFKGMDKPVKLKSINNVSIIWVEESAELKYAGFKELIGRLRHPSLSLHILLSTNPAPKSNWTYFHFFESANISDNDLYEQKIIKTQSTYYHHSTAEDNYFLPDSYIEELDNIKEYDMDLHRIARNGQYGVHGVLVFPQLEVMEHSEVMKRINGCREEGYQRITSDMQKAGFDFGFQVSYNALIRIAIDHEQKFLYIYWEYYKNKMTDDETAEELEEFIHTGEEIKGDSAEPKTIQFYKHRGFNIRKCKKFKGSRLQYTKKVKRFKKIYCSSNCVNTIKELKELSFKTDKNGNIIEDEFEIDPHTLSAIWYALDDYDVSDIKGTYNISF